MMAGWTERAASDVQLCWERLEASDQLLSTLGLVRSPVEQETVGELQDTVDT